MYFTSPTVRGDDIIVVVGRNATIEYLGHLRRMNISYVMIEDVSDLGAAFEAIGTTFGIRRISVQGGGILNGAMFAAGLFDEVSLVVYPGLDGLSGVPSIFEYVNGATDSPAGGQRLQLIDVSRRDYGAVWLRYVVHKG